MAARGVALAMAGGLLLTGCGGGEDPPGADSDESPSPASPALPEPVGNGIAGGPDPCALLTDQEISDTVGAGVTGAAGPVEEFMGTQCEWYFPGDAFGDGQVTVSVWVGLDFYSPEAPGEQITDFEPVSSIGDAAHRWPPLDGMCTVIFRKGEVTVQVHGVYAEDACVDLARIAADRV